MIKNCTKEMPAIYNYVELEKRSPIAVSLPRVVCLEITNKCVLRCRTCPRTYFKLEDIKTMAWKEFVRIAEQFSSVQRVVFAGVGEPLQNENLPRMIAYFKDSNSTVMVSTNAALLGDKISQELIDSGLDELRWSIDGANPDMYYKIGGVRLFQVVTKNIRNFCEIQRKRNVDKPKVSIWMTCIRKNIGNLSEMVRLAADIGVSEVNLNPMVYFLDSVEPLGLMTSAQPVYVDSDEKAKCFVSEAEAMAAKFNITLNTSGPATPYMNKMSNDIERRPWEICKRPWLQIHVSANGNCLPCGVGPFATVYYNSLIMGNLFKSELKEVWNNNRYQVWRRTLLSDYPPVPCRGCGKLWAEVRP